MDSTSELDNAIDLYKQQRYNETLDVLRRAIERQPHNGKLWELLGITHHAMGDNAQATHALEVANTLVPLFAGGQCVLAKCYAAAGHKELAGDMYRHVLSLQDLPGRILPVVATGLGALGEYALALDACRRAAACEIDDGQPLFGMAHYMQRLGHPPEMIASVLRKAVAIEPDCFKYRYALANTCYCMGRMDEAYTALQDIVDPKLLGTIRCPNCVRRMQAIFETSGDRTRCDACRERLRTMESDCAKRMRRNDAN